MKIPIIIFVSIMSIFTCLIGYNLYKISEAKREIAQVQSAAFKHLGDYMRQEIISNYNK